MLGTASEDEVWQRLLGERVGLAFDAAAVARQEGRCAVDLILRLLVRVWPRVAIVDLSGRHGTFADGLAALARSINPEVRLSGVPGDVALTLVVGETALVGHWPAFYVGSRGWVARFSPEAPVGSGSSANPFGASVAACLGVANAFRTAFADAFRDPGMRGADGPVDLSVFDYTRGEAASDPDLTNVDLGETHIVGVDGIGSAAAWAIARMPDLSGTIHFVDGEVVGVPGLRRNVLATSADVGEARVDVAATALRETAVEVHAHAAGWPEYIAGRGDWHLPRVAVAAGSAVERVAIQASLPGVVLNAWTQPDDLGVSRHPDFLRAPCLACLYGPRDAEPSTSEMVATDIGLPDAEPEIQDMLYHDRPLDRPLAERIAAANGVEVGALLPFVGTTVEEFHRRAVGSGLLDAAGVVDGRRRGSAMAFQSALAGVLLAAEIVIDAGLPRSPLPALTRIDLGHPLAEYLTMPAPRDPYGRCICGDADYREVYARKYLS